MVNWTKWILERLPLRLRTVMLYALCIVLTSSLIRLYDEFMGWRVKMRIKAGGTPQVCMLKKVVYDELGINIEIEEGDGKPYDFIIKTAFSDIDKERQLFALLDRYKLAGKSYRYANAKVVLNYEWGGYVCEQQTAFITWREYLCEEKYRPIFYVYLRFDGQSVHVELKSPLASDMNIKIYRFDFNGSTGGAINEYEVIFYFKKGDSGTYRKDFPYAYHLMTNITLSKNEDETYIYKYKLCLSAFSQIISIRILSQYFSKWYLCIINVHWL